MHLLTIGNNKEKCAPLLEWIVGGGNYEGGYGRGNQ